MATILTGCDWLKKQQKRGTARAFSNEVDLNIYNIVLIEFW